MRPLPLRATACLLAVFTTFVAHGQSGLPTPEAVEPRPELLSRHWDAFWIGPPASPALTYGVHHFRRAFDLETVPERFLVHLSADNRYRLFVNGTPVHIGPARGELEHWRFDSLDLAPWLVSGRNVLAVKVWNFGEHRPVAQETAQTAFILQGDGPLEAVANTDRTWRVFTNPAYTPLTGFGPKLQTYIVVGPGDELDAARYPWGWEQPEFPDASWGAAAELRRGQPRGTSTDGIWQLVPRQIPLMEASPVRLARIRQQEGVEVPEAFLEGDAPFTVPPHSKATLLFDQEAITTAYPELTVSGGKGSSVRMTYAESLFEGPHPSERNKGNRAEVAGKHLRGFEDAFRPDGGEARLFRPLRWRTYRYLGMDIETGAEPLTIHDLRAEFTAYPFAERATFASSDPMLEQIWDIAWRTLRIGTHEIYTDSPYYEQLSYVGDTRIEALVSLYVSGDDRLMRKSIEAFDTARSADGLTPSRWPDSRFQRIPPYSLVWVSMVHDYWRLRDDPAFVRARLPGVREVLRYFEEHSGPATGSYTGRLWWNFVDWIPEWGRDPVVGLGGSPPRDPNGNSAILDLQHVYTLQQAADLFAAFGEDATAETYAERAQAIRQHVLDTCWDETRGLLADTPERTSYSEHAHAYLILTAPKDEPGLEQLARRVIDSPDIIRATLYFSYYTHRAWIRAGLGDEYLSRLDRWRSLPGQGLTTVPEIPTPASRSDSHAWGTHPILRFLDTVAGIQPLGPGFRAVHIEPHPGPLNRVEASMPHPRGLIEVQLKRRGRSGLEATVTIPPGLPATFGWQGERRTLEPGVQTLVFP